VIRLGVNIDHVATVRQARRDTQPDPVAAAVLAILGGADGITVHLREDRRHIQDRDLQLLKPVVPNLLNLEMAVAEDILDIACEIKPHQATLVPEKRQEVTTEGGLDVLGHREEVARAVERLKKAEIHPSLFIDADVRQVDASRDIGAGAIEFHTGAYADAKTPAERARQLELLRRAADHARVQGLHVHMGHGLNYDNVAAIARIPGVEELNIGFSIVGRAVLVGMERAVRDMKDAIRTALTIP
jgi:pyridoxine 5-phosphate synthase